MSVGLLCIIIVSVEFNGLLNIAKPLLKSK